jgi:hypothetical protein
VFDSGASHHCGVIGDRTLYVCVLYTTVINFGSHVHYIGADDGVHCPVIEGAAPNQGMGGRLGTLWPSPLDINSNIPPINLHGSILNSKLETKIRLSIYFSAY